MVDHSFVEENCAFEEIGLEADLVAAFGLLDAVVQKCFAHGPRDQRQVLDLALEADLGFRA